MSLWQSFENRVQTESDLRGYLCLQFPLEVRILSGGRTIKVKSKPDFTVGIDSTMVLFDAKSTQEDRWNRKANVFRKDSRANKIHQWNQLKAATDKGVRAGYLIWFINLRRIVWASVETIEALHSQQHASLTPDSPLVTSQPDDEVINLRRLVFPDKPQTGRLIL